MVSRAPITGKRSKVAKIKPGKARKIIRRYHTLLKLRSQPGTDTAGIDRELASLGGIEKYQQASLSGQSTERGGDSSRVLVEWLAALKAPHKSLLEVGCLHVDNSCAGFFDEHIRIDLNSQHPDIEQQDFMERPVPDQKIGCVSLSLVVNFVPDHQTRGAMLQHAWNFLQKDGLLFFVLPLPCVENSRYFNEDVLNRIWDSIGFELVRRKTTDKLAYWLLRKGPAGTGAPVFKSKVDDGARRNNFCITLQ